MRGPQIRRGKSAATDRPATSRRNMVTLASLVVPGAGQFLLGRRLRSAIPYRRGGARPPSRGPAQGPRNTPATGAGSARRPLRWATLIGS
jgi:hypothetical protein